jgi:hypothetical protein
MIMMTDSECQVAFALIIEMKMDPSSWQRRGRKMSVILMRRENSGHLYLMYGLSLTMDIESKIG